MENGPFIDDFPIKPPIYKGFSMAMLNNQMVNPMVDSCWLKFSLEWSSEHVGKTNNPMLDYHFSYETSVQNSMKHEKQRSK